MNPSRWSALILAGLIALTIPLSTVSASSSVRATTAAVPITQATSATDTFQNLPVSGTTAGGGTFSGLLDIVKFKVVDGVLYAVGDLTGTLKNSLGNVIGSITDQRVRLPVDFGAISSCDILRLKLGPIDLNLLGLKVHLDKIVLDITADAGPGDLVGNLLCAIAGILDKGLNLNGVLRDILNALIDVV